MPFMLYLHFFIKTCPKPYFFLKLNLKLLTTKSMQLLPLFCRHCRNLRRLRLASAPQARQKVSFTA